MTNSDLTFDVAEQLFVIEEDGSQDDEEPDLAVNRNHILHVDEGQEHPNCGGAKTSPLQRWESRKTKSDEEFRKREKHADLSVPLAKFRQESGSPIPGSPKPGSPRSHSHERTESEDLNRKLLREEELTPVERSKKELNEMKAKSKAKPKKVQADDHGAKHRLVPFFDEYLQSIPLFGDCSKPFIDDLIERTRPYVYQMGSDMYVEEGNADCMMVLGCGSVSVLKQGIAIGHASAISCFGKEFLVGIHYESQYTLRAESVCYVQALDRKELASALVCQPSQIKMFPEGVLQKNLVGDEGYTLKIPGFPVLPLFESCSKRFKRRIRRFWVMQVFFPGEIITKEQDEAHSLIVLGSGSVCLERDGRLVSEKESGWMFGELAILGINRQRCFTVRARKLSVVWMMHRECLIESAFREFPEDGKHLMDTAYTAGVTGMPTDMSTKSKEMLSNCLKYVTFFQDCSVWFLAALAKSFEERMYVKGQKIIAEGEEGDILFVLIKGTVCVEALHGQFGKNLGTGSVFGEMAVFGVSSKRTATIHASEACCIMELHRRDLLRSLEVFGEERSKFLQMASERLQTLKPIMLDAENKPRAITDHSLFNGLPSEFIAKLSENVEERIFMPGDDLVVEGDTGQHMFILLSGDVVVLKQNNRVKTLKAAHGCQVIGELSCLGLVTVRATTVRAETVCLVHALGHEAMLNLLKSSEESRVRFERVVSIQLEKDLQDLVLELPLLKGCDARFLTMLVMNIETRMYMPHTMICKEGSTSDSMIILNKGHARLIIAGEDLGPLPPGSHFASASMLKPGSIVHASLHAVSMCHCVLVAGHSFITCHDRYRQLYSVDVKSRIEQEAWWRKLREREHQGALATRMAMQYRLKQRRLMMRIERDSRLRGRAAADPRLMIPAFQKELQKVQILADVLKGWLGVVKFIKKRRQEREIVQEQTKDDPALKMREWVEKRKVQLDRVRPDREEKQRVKDMLDSRGPMRSVRNVPSSGPAAPSAIEAPEPVAPPTIPQWRQTAGMWMESCTVPKSWPSPRPSPFYRLRSTHAMKGLGSQLLKLPPIKDTEVDDGMSAIVPEIN
eukprot:gnl/MRDRNA2_/MRDRNA2_85163_c0_seq3.p1 gnl/MRDRNA2_/MRDRNA2_85163_c0~~gnl/MRDRNA2_/MRDRNA2_85163_c0_seq3.p1  ORF type:complete len:1075 (-),score=221.10 gnl/MRDRNA2_/MRDRNA2_85163_c0_seq3:94-3318(-)